MPRAAGIAATVNGQPIPEVAVQRALQKVRPNLREQARPEIVNYLIDNALIDQYLLQRQVPVDAKEVDRRIQEFHDEIQKSGQKVEAVLSTLLLTEEEVKAAIIATLRWEKFAADQTTDKALRDFFAANTEMFDGTMVRCRHVLLMPPAGDAKAAEQAKAQLLAYRKQVEDQTAAGLAKLPPTADNATREKERLRLTETAFADVAREKSACPSKQQGGDLGWFPRIGNMVEPFARAAFALKPGQMSDLVPTQFGYHLILATDRRPGKETKFEDVQEEVKEVYGLRLRENVAGQLRQNATLVVNPAPRP
jgi:peptidyl-prolyl cis-trans isomerase C